MTTTLAQLFPDLPVLEILGRKRLLHYGVLASMRLEMIYGSLDSATAAVSRVILRHEKGPDGVRPIPFQEDLLNLLWGCLLEDAEDAGEVLTIPQVRRAMRLDQMKVYIDAVQLSIVEASPPPNPPGPGQKADALGTGVGSIRGASDTANGIGADS
jgi:hypothetical protein